MGMWGSGGEGVKGEMKESYGEWAEELQRGGEVGMVEGRLYIGEGRLEDLSRTGPLRRWACTW